MNPSRINHLVTGSYIDVRPNFDIRAWLSSSGRFNPMAIIAAPGTGKSRFTGRVLVWHDFIQGTPQIVIDPTGGTYKNFIDKLNRWAPDFERRFWETYKKPLTPEWIRYIDDQLQQMVNRVDYVDMNGQGSFPFYYRLYEDESLFDIAQRFVELIRRIDPALETASIEGFNTVYRIGTYAGMLLSALGLQITEAEDLIRNPEKWGQRMNQALIADPTVWPAVRFFRKFGELRPEVRTRGSESFLTKILAFSADPTMAAMFGSSKRTVNPEDDVANKRTVILDYSKVSNAERRRMLLLWSCSEIFTFAKLRGSAGRQAPLAVVIDETTQLLKYQQNSQSLMAAELQEWMSVISRNYGIWLTVIFQSLSQVNKEMQSALLQGNQIIGTLPDPEDAERIANYHFVYDPKWVRKKTPMYMAISSDPYYDPVPYQYRGVTLYMDHVSTRTTPTIIDWSTEEYKIEEQLQLLKQGIQHLPQYNFLVRASGIEGYIPAPLKLMDISRIDAGIHPDEERVAEACRRLMARSGFSKEQVLEEIKQRTSKPVHKQKMKTKNRPATLNASSSTPYASADNPPVQPDTNAPVHPASPPDGAANEDPWQV